MLLSPPHHSNNGIWFVSNGYCLSIRTFTKWNLFFLIFSRNYFLFSKSRHCRNKSVKFRGRKEDTKSLQSTVMRHCRGTNKRIKQQRKQIVPWQFRAVLVYFTSDEFIYDFFSFETKSSLVRTLYIFVEKKK